MGLQLKGDDSGNNSKSNLSGVNFGDGLNMGSGSSFNKPTGGGEKDPWEYRKQADDLMDSMRSQPVVTNNVSTSGNNNNSVVSGIIKVIMAFVIVGALVFGGKAIVSVVIPAGEDITEYVNKSEKEISSGLGITLANNTEWIPQIHQWTNDGKVTVHSNEDVGVVFIDGKQMGLHIHTKKYKIYNIQIGMGEIDVNKGTTFKYDGFMNVLNDMQEGKTTTYYYYNNSQNDCVAVTINDTTNRVTGITYFNDFKKVTESLE